MKYVGYQKNLPLGPGDVVVVPKGTLVKTFHPKRREYVTVRAQKVLVNHTLPGCSWNYGMIGEREARDFGLNFEALMELRRTDSHKYHDSYHHVSNPTVVWAGTGGYWCEVDINVVIDSTENS